MTTEQMAKAFADQREKGFLAGLKLAAKIADDHARGGEYGEAACNIADEIRALVAESDEP